MRGAIDPEASSGSLVNLDDGDVAMELPGSAGSIEIGDKAINTLAMATIDRSRDFSLLRLTAATPRQVRSMLRWELALAVIVAVVLATIASWSTLTAFSIGMTGRATLTVEPLTYAGRVFGSVLLGAVALLLPARTMLRRNPADEMTSGQWAT